MRQVLTETGSGPAVLVMLVMLALMPLAAMAAQFPAGGESGVPPGYRLIAGEYGIPAALLYAMALTESRRTVRLTGRHTARPWPWTLNVAGRGHWFSTRRDAWRALRRNLAAGRRSIDIGLMQVNWRYHRGQLLDPWTALDPYHNLRVGARILRQCFDLTGDWWQAAGCYHAPGPDKASQARAARYRARVRDQWRRLAD